jgi:hypothetical protein
LFFEEILQIIKIVRCTLYVFPFYFLYSHTPTVLPYSHVYSLDSRSTGVRFFPLGEDISGVVTPKQWIWVSCTRSVPLLSEHENAYISTSTRRIWTIVFLKHFVESILLTVKLSSFWLSALRSFQSRKVKNHCFFGNPYQWESLFYPDFWLDENNLLELFRS